MATRISIDKAGRVVLPKSLREKMRVEAGDEFLIETEGDRIPLRPIGAEATLKKELGIWVYQASLRASLFRNGSMRNVKNAVGSSSTRVLRPE